MFLWYSVVCVFRGLGANLPPDKILIYTYNTNTYQTLLFDKKQCYIITIHL